MGEVRYSNIAAKIASYMSLFWWLGVFAGGLALALLGVGEITAFIGIIIIPLIFLAAFLALRIVLPRACQQYELGIQKRGVLLAVRGGALIGLAWGLVWRCFIIVLPFNFLASKIVVQSDLIPIIGVLILALSFFFASLWLLKHQLGSITISKLRLDSSVTYDHLAQQVIVKELSSMQVAKDAVQSILSTSVVLSYFAIGFVQLAAVVSFFHEYWGWWYIPSILVASFVAYIPVVGAIAGVCAAIEVWHWTWYWAALLFFFPIILGIIWMGIVGSVESILSKFRS